MLLVFFIALLNQNSATLSVKNYQSLYGDVAKAFNDILISKSILMKRSEVFSKIQCQAHCMHDASCMSFFHGQAEGLCQTHSIVFLDYGYGKPSLGTRYYILHEADHRNQDYLYRRDLNMKVSVSTNRLVWRDADDECNRNGRRLVSLDTWPKFHFVTDMLKASSFYNVDSSEFHVGLFEPGPNGIWFWKSGAPLDVNSEMWCKADDQPDNGNLFAQKEASLWNRPICPMTLDDKYFYELAYYICEIPS